MKIQKSWTAFQNQFKLFTFVSGKVILIIISETGKFYPQIYLPLKEQQ